MVVSGLTMYKIGGSRTELVVPFNAFESHHLLVIARSYVMLIVRSYGEARYSLYYYEAVCCCAIYS